MFYVYIIQSKKDNNLYVGSTNDLKRRFEEHNLKLDGRALAQLKSRIKESLLTN